jgi:hypothetical protein
MSRSAATRSGLPPRRPSARRGAAEEAEAGDDRQRRRDGAETGGHELQERAPLVGGSTAIREERRIACASFTRQGRWACGKFLPALRGFWDACSFHPKKKKAGRCPGLFRQNECGLSVLANVRGLQSFGSLRDVELDLLPFAQRAEAISLNSRVMDENIRSILTRDESISLRIVEPLHLAGCHLLPSYER